MARAANLVREVGNLPPNHITPATLAERARALAKTHGLAVKVWDEKQLKREGFGGILAVGQGSANPPRFISLEYRGKGASSAAPYVVVGKAITFDSGGISIKPGEGMDEMKFDKMGGVAVLGILQAVSELKLPIRVVGLISSAENMPGSRAYRPGDIVTTYNGQTIEVLNTDAEGRIVLADALAYAVKHLKPKLMFDMATLTGAVVVALGGGRTGLFATDEKIRQDLWENSEEAGDPAWPLPFAEEYSDQIKSDVALVKNTGGRQGGASTAASFLHHWTGDTPWVHLDIAGTAWTTKELPYLEKGATGAGVRLITDYLRRKAK
ncbi:MAG: leucyl aminopeptidase [Verrucomicrobium sp.]|nr:leucyl aminopeptidase [Verrucomicrobium sp.]